MDCRYLELFNRCWSCDNRACFTGKLSIEVFEQREKQAAEPAKPIPVPVPVTPIRVDPADVDNDEDLDAIA